MKKFERVEIESVTQLREWLLVNHGREESVWLVTYKKHIPDKHVPWEDIVDEGLCFGWIDSLPRKLDADRSMRLFSPRRTGSPWSRRNKTRVAILLAAGRMAPSGLAVIEKAKQDGSWTIYDEVDDLIIPQDLLAELSQNQAAEQNFGSFSDSSKKNILWWIKSAKSSATRDMRIKETVWLAEHKIRANHPEARAFKRKYKG